MADLMSNKLENPVLDRKTGFLAGEKKKVFDRETGFFDRETEFSNLLDIKSAIFVSHFRSIFFSQFHG